MAIAMLKNFHGALYERILRHGNALFVAGLGAAATVFYCLDAGFPNTLTATTLGFSLVAASFALMLLAALSPHSVLNRVWVPGAASFALWSYAVYLAHKPIFMALRPQLERMSVDRGAPLTVLLVMAAGVLGGWLLFRLVETPFMQLRSRWYPARRADSAPASAPMSLQPPRAEVS